MRRSPIRTFREVLLLVLLIMALLAVLRVPWAVTFWRRVRLAAWLYVFLVLALAAIYAYRIWG